MALRRFCGRGNPKTMLRTTERTLSESKNMKELEVTESRTDHQRAHLRRDHLVLQPALHPHIWKEYSSQWLSK